MLSHLGGYVGHMLGIGWLSWAYVGPMLAYVGPMLAYVGPMLSHLGGYVGHLLGICWLSWAYVGDMLGNLCLKNLPRLLFPIFPSRKAKTLEKLTFFDIANRKFSAAEGPITL